MKYPHYRNQYTFKDQSFKNIWVYQKAFNILFKELILLNKEGKITKETNESKENKIEKILYDIKHEVHEIKQKIILEQKKIKTVSTQTDIQIEFIKKNKEFIKKVEDSHININDYIKCLTLLSDFRIASGSFNGHIRICNMDSLTSQWKNQITKNNAHNDCIQYISELTNKRIASCSNDCTIKIWNIAVSTNLNLISTIPASTKEVIQVIPLVNNRLASISKDKTIKIWKNLTNFFCDSKYEKLYTSFETQSNYPTSIFQLKNQEILCMSTCNNDNLKEVSDGELKFFDLYVPFNMKGTIQGVFTRTTNGMIQLNNGNIVINKHDPPSKIIIVDSIRYKVIKEIITDDNIGDMCGFVCLNSNDSFTYVHKGEICIFIFENGEYIKSNYSKKIEEDIVVDGITTQNGKYIITVSQKKKGLNIFEVKE